MQTKECFPQEAILKNTFYVVKKGTYKIYFFQGCQKLLSDV